MDHIKIRRPRIEEIDSIEKFFAIVLKDTFEKNGIGDLKALEEEIQNKKRCIRQDFESDGKDRHFLLAEYNNSLIGSAEYGISNELLNQCTRHKFRDVLEIGTVFVHPGYQRRGISSLLLSGTFQNLYDREVKEICFDSGYRIAQKIWCKRFGDPEYCFRDYWGKGSHYMIWKVKVEDAFRSFCGDGGQTEYR